MATHSSTLAWKIPWKEEPGRLQSTGSQRVGHDWATSLSLFTFMHWRRKWQPTPFVLAWRIPGTGEPGGLPSTGLHRVGHDWSDLAAAAAKPSSHLIQPISWYLTPGWCPFFTWFLKFNHGLLVLHLHWSFLLSLFFRVPSFLWPFNVGIPLGFNYWSFPCFTFTPLMRSSRLLALNAIYIFWRAS